MKQITLLFLSLMILSCSDDDNQGINGPTNFELIVELVSHDRAKISWNYSDGSGNVVYEIVLNGEEVADDYSAREYEFLNLQENTEYSGKVFAKPQNGNISFVEFNFTTEYFHYFVRSQQDVDDFNLTSINGTLYIEGDDITDLTGLTEITNVGGLRILACPLLESLEGLNNLSTFYRGTGLIEFQRNDNLNDVSALSQLSSFASGLVLRDNQNLTDLSGLNISAGGSLQIYDSPIQDLSHFDELEQLGSLVLVRLPNITSLQGFGSLSSLNKLVLRELNSFSGFDGLGQISSLEELEIKYVYGINDFTNLDSINEIGQITVWYSGITSLNGLGNLSVVDGINIQECNALTNLDGTVLNTSSNGQAYLHIQGNNNLTDFCGLTTWANNVEFTGFIISQNGFNPTKSQLRSTSQCVQ